LHSSIPSLKCQHLNTGRRSGRSLSTQCFLSFASVGVYFTEVNGKFEIPKKSRNKDPKLDRES